MDRIQDETASQTRPDYTPSGTKGYAVNYNPETKTPATVNTAEQYNAIQETLMHIIEEAGLAGNHQDDSLLTQAVKKISNSEIIQEHSDKITSLEERGKEFILWEGNATSGTLTLNNNYTDYQEIVFYPHDTTSNRPMPQVFYSSDRIYEIPIDLDFIIESTASLMCRRNSKNNELLVTYANGRRLDKIMGIK